MTIKFKRIISFAFLFIITIVIYGCGEVLPTEIKINNEKFDYKIGEEVSISYEVLPADTTNKKVSFKSSDSSLAKVTEEGMVSFLKEGYVTITVTSFANSEISNDITFNVILDTILPTSINISCDKEIEIGNNLEINATVLPNDAENKEVTYSSSNEEILKIDNGIIKAIGLGKATITCTAVANPNIKETVEITVVEKTLQVSDFKAKVKALINSYLQASEASLEIETTSEQGTVVQKYSYISSNNNFTKLFYEIHDNNILGMYIIDSIVYMNAYGNKTQYAFDESEGKEIYSSLSVNNILGNIANFYLEDAFYNALEFVKINDNEVYYILDIREYSGSILSTLNIDKIQIIATLENDSITQLKYIAETEGVETSVLIKFNGFTFNQIFPEDLSEYPE